MRNQAIKKLTCSAVMIVWMTVLTGCVSSQSVQESPVTDNAQANEDIIEMYQNEAGSITVPEVLQPYMNGRQSIG